MPSQNELETIQISVCQIMSKAKTVEERHFYISLCVKEKYSARELERQMDSTYYERYILSSKKVLPEHIPRSVRGSIFDTYVLEFLDLPEQFSERNLRKAIIENLKQFILEFGKEEQRRSGLDRS